MEYSSPFAIRTSSTPRSFVQDNVDDEPLEPPRVAETDPEETEGDRTSQSGSMFSHISPLFRRPFEFMTPPMLPPLYQNPNQPGASTVEGTSARTGEPQASTSENRTLTASSSVTTDPTTSQASSQQNTASGSSEVPSGRSTSSDTNRSTATTAQATEEIPEGVDPSFLEALPPEMRREVLEQHRMLRLQQRISLFGSSGSSDQAVAGGSSEVSPEFLAALPPSLQEEVLTQQRLEQQRQAAARANPDEPVDAASFFETLQPSLRTMVSDFYIKL